MKRTDWCWNVLAIGLLISGAGHPEQKASAKQCSLRTLKGTYVWHFTGFQIVNGQPVHFAFAGQDHYNGDGTMTGVYSFSDNGAISQNVSYSCTYTVNPDCTGTLTQVDENGLVGHFDLFFGREGAEVSFVVTYLGFVAAGVDEECAKEDSHLPVVESNFNADHQCASLWNTF